MTRIEDRLRAALRDGSGQQPATDTDWEEFEARLARTQRMRRTAHWRVPLIAAAAVAVIAVTASAIVTDGFGAGADHSAGSGGGAAHGSAAAVTVPIATAGQQVDAAGGAAGGDAGAGSASPPTSQGGPVSVPASAAPSQGLSSVPSPSPGTTGASQTDSGHPVPGVASSIAMSFAGGHPPTAELHGTVTLLGGTTADAGSHSSDGSPLGYLSLSAGLSWSFGLADGTQYLWGAVGPDVAQVQVGALEPPKSGDFDPGFHSGANWTIDSGRGTAFSLPDASTTVWTDLGEGWHGFAVRIPGDATSVSVVALNARGLATQLRQFDPATGRYSDESVPEQTTPPATPNAGPELSAGASASAGGSEYPAPSTMSTQ